MPSGFIALLVTANLFGFSPAYIVTVFEVLVSLPYVHFAVFSILPFADCEIVPFMVTVTDSPAGMLEITVLNLLPSARHEISKSSSPILIPVTVISVGISSETVTSVAVALPSFLTVIV